MTLIGVVKLAAELGRKRSWNKVWGALAVIAGLQFIVYGEDPRSHQHATYPIAVEQVAQSRDNSRNVQPTAQGLGDDATSR